MDPKGALLLKYKRKYPFAWDHFSFLKKEARKYSAPMVGVSSIVF